MIFEIRHPSTGHIYDDRVPLEKALKIIAGDQGENEKKLITLEEDAEVLCKSRHVPSFKVVLKKISLGDLLDD
ncbi:hypothetical protein CL629_02095 [bacterium]|nr:hypothetical protein [bacterium]|tara:strand:- start:4613 stop:4831 length:219 start_codon:yes stop_codon:yes gene_type:complete